MTENTHAITEIDPGSFQAIADIAFHECGLRLLEDKTSMIQSRLRRRLQELGLRDFGSYCKLLKSDKSGAERKFLISALTTNVSHFFREMHHFQTLREVILHRATDLKTGARCRIWSAGCANGQEAFSAAMVLLDVLPKAAELNIRILGTDVDTKVIQWARAGVFPERWMGGVTPDQRASYFTKKSDGKALNYEVGPALKQLVQFNELNLLAPWPMRGQIDIIFCRNVVIYFDVATQERLWPRFARSLAQDGLLFLGHSEHIARPEEHGFRCTGKTTYERLRKH